MPCREQVVSRWNKQLAFRRAMNSLIDECNDTLGRRATTASLGRAIRGSIKDYELYLRRTAQLPDLMPRATGAVAAAQAAASSTVIFQGVPPPPEPLVLPPADPNRATTVVPAPPHL